MKLKRFITVCLVVLLCIVAVSCMDDSAQKGQDEKDNPTDKMDSSKYIAFCHKSMNYYAFCAMMESMRRACEKRGWKFESAVADMDSAKQTNQIMNFIAKGPDAILSDPIDSEGIIDALDKSVESGIPVAIIDTPTTGGDVSITVAFDNYLAGQMAAEEIVKRLIKKYGEPKGLVFNAYATMTSWAWRLRKEGFEDVLKRYPNIGYLAMPTEGDIKKVTDVFLNALAKYKYFDAVHAPSDHPALGLVEVLKQKGQWKKVGEEGHVILVTIDGEPNAIKGIEEGYYDATICQDCRSYGEIAIELLDDYTFNGKSVPKIGFYRNRNYYWLEAPFSDSPSGPNLVIPPYVIDKNNYDDTRHWGNVTEDWDLFVIK